MIYKPTKNKNLKTIYKQRVYILYTKIIYIIIQNN